MKKELLAPAGDFETLKQAIHNGCDAVYLGGKKFGARKFASNFDDEEMIKAIKYCHLYGVKIYVTVNTVIFDSEVDECLDYLTFLHQNGVDAVIMQDLGMITLVRQVLPNLDIHVSIQAHTHNLEQIHLLESLGVTRVVVAREMSLEEIQKLDTKLEIEAFIHGALCVCYSGQCLFSSLLLNRSGNRGECAGICRLPFTLLEDGKEIKTEGKYLLSPKELNTTNHIKELLESNITSFKIEGRMKSPTTIGYITRLYRMLIDHYEKNEEVVLTKEEQEKLMVLFHRGFTDGYLFHSSGKQMMNILSPNHIGIEIGKVIQVTPKRIRIQLEKELNQGDGIRFLEEEQGMNVNFLYDLKGNLISGAKPKEIIEMDNKVGITTCCTVRKTVDTKFLKELENYPKKKIPVTISITAKLGKPLWIELSDFNHKVSISEDCIQKATGNGTNKERILEQLSKLGDSAFFLQDSNLEIDTSIFIPISTLNQVRRKLVEELTSVRENEKKEVIIKEKPSILKQEDHSKIIITALVRNENQLKACLEENVDMIYVTDESLYEKYSADPNIYLRMNRVMNSFPNHKKAKLLIGETGSLWKYHHSCSLVTDYYLNVTNSYLVSYLKKLGVSNITLSIENSIETIAKIVSTMGNQGLEVLVYGKVEAMIMKYCPLKMLVNQDKSPCKVCQNGKKYELKDRNGEKYPVVQEKELTHLFYYHNRELENELLKLKKVGIMRYRFDFFDENCSQIKAILKKYKTMLL